MGKYRRHNLLDILHTQTKILESYMLSEKL